ncbi:MAG TPA: lactococcin 972 family bacteriocin [Clostridiales bacterium]|nr:lactococcin 972 family bacteriocin [Clostridiales bacterium]
MSLVILTSMVGVGTASAAIQQNVGGGVWSISKESRMVTSQYYHGSRQHGSSARMGNGRIYRECRRKGATSFARATGNGTRYAWWHRTCEAGHFAY